MIKCNHSSDAFIDTMTRRICLRCVLPDCQAGGLSPSHRDAVYRLRRPPACPVNWAVWQRIELDKAAEAAEQTLNPDRPETLIEYHKKLLPGGVL